MPLSWRQLASLIGPPGLTAPQQVWISAPQANEKRILLRAPQALTINRVDAVLSGGSSPSVSFHLRHGSDVSAAGTAVTSAAIITTSTTIGSVVTSFQFPEVAAEHWLWLEITAVTGSPTALTVAVLLQ